MNAKEAALAYEIAVLRAKVEELRADAERYRWLREWEEVEICNDIACVVRAAGDDLDAAIDAAMREGKRWERNIDKALREGE